MRRIRPYILALFCAAFLAAFLIAPIVLAIRSGFMDEGHLTWLWLKAFGNDIAAREGLVNAIQVAAATTLGVVLLAVPLAVIANHYRFRGKALASAMLMVPMILPSFVGAIAISQLLAYEYGSVNLILAAIGLPKVNWLRGGFWGVVILETLHLYPIMYLNAAAALANLDPTMLEAARNLGASRWQAFRKVTLPLIRPGLFAGATLVFIWSFTELGTPKIVGYEQMLPVQIFDALNTLDTSPKTFTMVFVMLSASVGLYAMGKFLFGRHAAAGGGRGVSAVERRAGVGATLLIWLAFASVTAVAMLPHVGVVLLSVSAKWSGTILPTEYTFQYLREVFTRADTWGCIANSLQYASLATVIDIVFGLAIAYLVVRSRLRGASLLDGAAMLPLAVPGLVIASGYIVMTATPPDIPGLKEFLLGLNPRNDPMVILVIAYSIRRLPYVVRSISAGLEQTPPMLEEAARNLGSGPAGAVLRITVPLVLANILAGAILAFSFAMLDVSDSLILAQSPTYYPITKWIFTHYAGSSEAASLSAAMGTFGMLLLTATLISANLLLGKRLGAMFRV